MILLHHYPLHYHYPLLGWLVSNIHHLHCDAQCCSKLLWGSIASPASIFYPNPCSLEDSCPYSEQVTRMAAALGLQVTRQPPAMPDPVLGVLDSSAHRPMVSWILPKKPEKNKSPPYWLPEKLINSIIFSWRTTAFSFPTHHPAWVLWNQP